MDWSNERYVRVYTRDTADLIAVGWEGRFVFYELVRKVDRAGVLDYGGDLAVVPDILRLPPEVFEVALPRLLQRGCVVQRDSALVIPNYLDAQEATQTDAARQRASRERRRARAMDSAVTPRDVSVTSGHVESRPVTFGHSVPDRAVPDRAQAEPSPRARDLPTPEPVVRTPITGATLATQLAWRLWLEHCDRHERLRVELKQDIPRLLRTEQAVGYRDLRERIRSYGDDFAEAGATCDHVLAVREAEARARGDLEWFGDVVWREDQFTSARRLTPTSVARPRAGPRRAGVGYAEPEQHHPVSTDIEKF